MLEKQREVLPNKSKNNIDCYYGAKSNDDKFSVERAFSPCTWRLMKQPTECKIFPQRDSLHCYFLQSPTIVFQHMKFIRKYLKATDLATDRQSVKKFVHKFLGYDGVFCMRMISAHAGDIMATELIVALWHNFNDR